MADRIELERAGDGTRWRVRHTGGDVEGHMPFRTRFAVEDEDVEGHRIKFKFSLEPDGEDEGGEPLFRIAGEGDAEGHMPFAKRFSEDDPDAEGHAMRGKFSLEPTGEEDGGDPVYRMTEGDDVEGHRRRFHT